MSFICLKPIAASLAALTLATSAFAQYIWLDENGLKQYSDQPPPTSVPLDHILKQPPQAPRTQGPAGSAPVANKETRTEGPKTEAAAPMTAAEKNAEFNKRRMEQAEKDKKAAEQAKAASDKAKNCERTRTYNQNLANGERVYHINKNGEREYLSDDQRAQEMKENKRHLDECK